MIRVTFTDTELTELISAHIMLGVAMEQSGEDKQALCCKITVGRLQSSLDSARAAKADVTRVTFTENELIEIAGALSAFGAAMENSPDQEAVNMTECCARLAGKLQNARRNEHEAKATKKTGRPGDDFAGKAIAVSSLAVMGGILFALLAH